MPSQLLSHTGVHSDCRHDCRLWSLALSSWPQLKPFNNDPHDDSKDSQDQTPTNSSCLLRIRFCIIEPEFQPIQELPHHGPLSSLHCPGGELHILSILCGCRKCFDAFFIAQSLIL